MLAPRAPRPTPPGARWRCDAGSPGERRGHRASRPETDRTDRRGGRLCCAACGEPITRRRDRIEVSGRHDHTFVNPHGIVFEIGCFAVAPGCAGVGPRQAFFSWFPGYAWRIEVCRGCAAHLGWSFGEGPHFYGLVLERLAEGNGEGDQRT